jgi:GMP synthase - Glutamine amidotransferase domain
MSPLRLAVLEADTPVPRTFARHGGYAGVFSYLFERAVAPEPLSSLLTITAHDVVSGGAEAYPDPDTVDAILISGSKHNAFDNDEWIVRLVDYVRDVVQNQPRIKVIGICFGHQIVGRALGAKVGRSDKGWEISVTETKLTEKGKEIFGGKKTLVSSIP